MASGCSPVSLWARQIAPEQSVSWGMQQPLGYSGLLHSHIHPPFPWHSAVLRLSTAGCGTDTLLFKQMSPLVLAAWGRCNLSNSAIEKTGNVTLSPIFITLWFLIPRWINKLLDVLMHQGHTNIWFYTISKACWYPSLSGKVYFLLARQQCCWGPNFAF